MKALLKRIVNPRNHKMGCYKLLNKLYFRLKGIRFGKNMQVYNAVYITGARGKITIGDHFHFTSGDCINPICRNIRGCIHTDSEQSEIVIGNHVAISSACIWIQKRLTIGNHVSIGGNCLILDTDVHQLDFCVRRGENAEDSTDYTSMVQSAPVVIEDDVWIGANCQILKGVTIGARSVIGAGSVVTRSIPSDCIAAGNPCKVIRRITK